MEPFLSIAQTVIARCRALAEYSEEPGFITRTFLSEPMRAVHGCLRSWMERAGMTVTVDHAGNMRGVYTARRPDARRLLIGSHLDTVPRAGAFDGILGVVLGVALIEILAGRRLRFEIEVIGFSEEEGVRFGVPFIGSRALIGDIDDELLARGVGDAITGFGLNPARIKGSRSESPFHRVSRVSYRTGTGARESQSPARNCGSDRRANPRRCDLRGPCQPCGNHTHEPKA